MAYYKFGSGIVSGIVTNNGIPQSGVTVTVSADAEGTPFGTYPSPVITNSQGQYSFKVPTDVTGFIYAGLSFSYNGKNYPPPSPDNMGPWPVQGYYNITAPNYDLADPYVGQYSCSGSTSGDMEWVKLSQANTFPNCSYLQMNAFLSKTPIHTVSSSTSSSTYSTASPKTSTMSTGEKIAIIGIIAVVGIEVYLYFKKKH